MCFMIRFSHFAACLVFCSSQSDTIFIFDIEIWTVIFLHALTQNSISFWISMEIWKHSKSSFRNRNALINQILLENSLTFPAKCHQQTKCATNIANTIFCDLLLKSQLFLEITVKCNKIVVHVMGLLGWDRLKFARGRRLLADAHLVINNEGQIVTECWAEHLKILMKRSKNKILASS